MRTGAHGVTAGLALALALAGCDRAPAPPAPRETAPPASAGPTEAPSAASETSEASGPPPWAAPALAQADAPAILVQEWHRAAAEAQPPCPALAPATLEGLAEASPRKANFGSGAWAVAWDWRGHPGRHASGEHCEDCGRGTFGVSGRPVNPEFTGDLTGTWPDNRRWDDGSAMGWGLEGGTGPGWLAYVAVADAHCSYNVWSAESEKHLLALIASLRFVEGLGAPPP